MRRLYDRANIHTPHSKGHNMLSPYSCSSVAFALYALPVAASVASEEDTPPSESPSIHLTHAILYCVAMHLLEVHDLPWLAWLLTVPPVLVGYVVGPMVTLLAHALRT